MATTTNLSLPIIVTGAESGTWGNLIDNGLTSYLDIAIAGGLSVPITTADVTLANTVGTNTTYPSTGIGSTTAQYVILNITGAKTAARNLNLPITSKWYIINNADTGSGGYLLTVRGFTGTTPAATTGITLVDGEKAIVAWNGSDYVKVSNQSGIGLFSGLGVGATPSTWSTGKAVEVGGIGAAVYGSSSVDMQITSNAYYNTAWQYATSAPAAKYQALSGTHSWSIAPTGIVGATTTIYTGQAYTVTTVGSTTLAQWQAFFSALTAIPVVTQVITATASGTLLGGATVTQSLTFVRAMGITNNGGLTVGSSATAYGTSGQVLTSAGDAPPIWSNGASQIQPISASVASNALTISASALSLSFRDTALTSGTVTTVSGTPANLVVPSGATLGSLDAASIVPTGPTSRLIVLAINNAGTIELGVVNLAGGNDLTETGVISTTAISAASDSANVIYSNSAITSKAYRVIGYIESTQTTAGTWATAPSTIQGCGGQALTAMSSLGYGQTWQIPTRVSGTTYYNTTGKPIMVSITGIINPGDYTLLTINGSYVAGPQLVGGSGYGCVSGIVPPSSYYVVNSSVITLWAELR